MKYIGMVLIAILFAYAMEACNRRAVAGGVPCEVRAAKLAAENRWLRTELDRIYAELNGGG